MPRRRKPCGRPDAARKAASGAAHLTGLTGSCRTLAGGQVAVGDHEGDRVDIATVAIASAPSGLVGNHAHVRQSARRRGVEAMRR